jgi:hypothetical protein
MEAVIIILKHATTLRPSNTPEQALTLAQVDYKKANVGLKIQEYLKIFPAEGSVEQFADFIMATNIGLLCIYLIQQYLISAFTLQAKQLHREDCQGKQFCGSISVKSIFFCQWLRDTRRKE